MELVGSELPGPSDGSILSGWLLWIAGADADSGADDEAFDLHLNIGDVLADVAGPYAAPV
jgi:hypothetical protein